jgi:ADP-ribosylglycohydrolase
MPEVDKLRLRARGALLGLAIGDALGAPADVHRTVRTPWVRGRLWAASADLDEQRVSRPLLPFAPTLSDTHGIVPTDDAEEAAVAALALLAAGDDDDALFENWLLHHAGDDVWLGVAARSAVVNAGWGLRPPQTGNDGPAADDDAAVPAALACAIRAAGDAEEAARGARRYASITHAGDGVDAAAFVAALVSALLTGTTFDTALARARREVTAGTWLASGLDDAESIARRAGSGFAAVVPLIRALSPRMYSHAGTAAETVPLAVAMVLLTQGDPDQAIPLSLTIARKADSLPAFVGALCGAIHGTDAFDPVWSDLDQLRGILLPSTAGIRLTLLADRLLAERPGTPERGTA